MAQIFNESANTLVRAGLAGAVIALTVLGGLGTALYRSPITTQVGFSKAQPIPFSHQRHVGGNGIDCRYCHTSVENASSAGIPPTETCMTCHSQILSDQAMFTPLQESWKNDQPLEWTRIYDLPEFAYFNHSVHVAKGVGCTTCHGEIDEMRLTRKVPTLHMAWCLQCHRNPEKFLRPLDKVFDVDWTPPSDQIEQGLQFVAERHIDTAVLDNCSICHR
ncbi:MAG: cytochrome C [Candidatus Hydrogenedens sp.]|nr:cytochrome C [Candidatus Hydrogenedens sp.]